MKSRPVTSLGVYQMQGLMKNHEQMVHFLAIHWGWEVRKGKKRIGQSVGVGVLLFIQQFRGKNQKIADFQGGQT